MSHPNPLYDPSEFEEDFREAEKQARTENKDVIEYIFGKE